MSAVSNRSTKNPIQAYLPLQPQLQRAALEEARFRAYAALIRKNKKERVQAAAQLLEAHADRLQEVARQHANQYIVQQPQPHTTEPPQPKPTAPSFRRFTNPYLQRHQTVLLIAP